MGLWVQVQNNQVTACIDTPPVTTNDPNWKPAIEIKPALKPYVEYYGQAVFDTTQNPVTITYPVLEWDSTTAARNEADAKAQEAKQAYASAIANGLIITSASTPAINGTYALEDSDIANLNAEASFISNFQEFTTMNTNALPWITMTGVVTFPSLPSFMSVAKAVAQYVSACKLAANGIGTFPANTVQVP